MENCIFCAVYIAICEALPNDTCFYDTGDWGRSTAQKMKFSIKNFLSKCDQIRRKLRIWSHLLKKSLMILISCTKCPVGKDLFLVNDEVVRIFYKVNVSVC